MQQRWSCLRHFPSQPLQLRLSTDSSPASDPEKTWLLLNDSLILSNISSIVVVTGEFYKSMSVLVLFFGNRCASTILKKLHNFSDVGRGTGANLIRFSYQHFPFSLCVLNLASIPDLSHPIVSFSLSLLPSLCLLLLFLFSICHSPDED